MIDETRKISDYYGMADVTIFHFIGILLVVTLATISERLRHGVHPFFLIIWNVPGVILHELCHLVVGLVFFARPTGFTIWPRKRETVEGYVWTLGAVSFGRITALNAVPLALAPLLLLVGAYLLYGWWFTFFPLTGGNIIGMYAAVFFLAYNALPSWPDIRIALNWRSMLLYGTIIAILCALQMVE